MSQAIRVETDSHWILSFFLSWFVKVRVELAEADPAMLLAGKVNCIDNLVHMISKTDVRLDRLTHCHGCDQVMGFNDLLIVVAQTDACQTEEGFVAGML